MWYENAKDCGGWARYDILSKMPKGARMIHLYTGENDFGLKRQVAMLCKQFTQKYGANGIERVDLAATNGDQALSSLFVTGLLADRRLVIITNAEKEFLEKLVKNVAQIPNEVEVVIVDPKPDGRLKAVKDLKKLAKVRDFPRISNLRQFILDEAADQEVEIKTNAVAELENFCGGDQYRIAIEIARFKSLGKVITVENIHKFVEPDISVDAFNILDDIFAGRKALALEKIKVLQKTEDPNKFWGLVGSQIFILAVAVNSDKSPPEIAKEFAIHPFRMQKALEVARRVSKSEIQEIAQIVADADAKLKTSDPAAGWKYVELAIGRF
jgi:DNA polymerase III delta subunit